jgi:hypothetical protein
MKAHRLLSVGLGIECEFGHVYIAGHAADRTGGSTS